MTRPLILACLLPGMMVASAAQAESGPLQQAIGDPGDFTLSASARLRYERVDGQVRPGIIDPDEQLALRTSLAVEYHPGGFVAGVEVYDSRAYLGRPGSALSNNDVDTVEPVQAYLGYDFAAPFGPGSKASVRAGRLMINLASRRFIASDDYRNTTNSYTGVKADLTARDGTTATLFYLLPQYRLPEDQPTLLDNGSALDKETFGLQLFGGVVARPRTLAGGTMELGYYGLAERDQPGRATRDRHLHTFTARFLRDHMAGQIDWEVEGAWQIGQLSASTAANAPRQTANAGMIHAEVGYLVPGAAKARFSLAYDWVSGDRPGGANTRFDTLFGYRRGEYAPSGIFAAIGRANLTGGTVRLELAPGKRLDVNVDYRAMWLASRFDAFSTSGVIDPTGRSGTFAGHLIDLRARYWLVPGVLRGELNYDWLAKGRFLKTAPNAVPSGNTNYVAVSLTATL